MNTVRKVGMAVMVGFAMTLAACTSSTTPTRPSTTLITVRSPSRGATPTTTSVPVTLSSNPTTVPGVLTSTTRPPTRGRASHRVSWITATGAAGNLWLLGEYGCPAGLCVMVLRSENGGARFVRVGAPPVYGERDVTTDGLSIGSLLFANKEDGYAYARGGPTGPSSLYRTGDGGMTWQLVHLEGALASEIVVAGGRAYAVAYRCRSADCTEYDLVSSSVTKNSWTTTNRLPSAETKDQNVSLAAFDSNVWLVLTPQGDGLGRFLVSQDRGSTFSALPGDSIGDAISCALTATSNDTLWGTCYSIHSSFNFRSTDGGRESSAILGSSYFGSTSLFPLSDREAVQLFYNPAIPVSLDWELEVTTDAGRSFQPVLGHQEVLAIGFATRTTWLALRGSMNGKGNLAWRTTNGGHSWRTINLPNVPVGR